MPIKAKGLGQYATLEEGGDALGVDEVLAVWGECRENLFGVGAQVSMQSHVSFGIEDAEI